MQIKSKLAVIIMGNKHTQKAGENSQQTQVCAQNYFNITIYGPLESECKKF